MMRNYLPKRGFGSMHDTDFSSDAPAVLQFTLVIWLKDIEWFVDACVVLFMIYNACNTNMMPKMKFCVSVSIYFFYWWW